MPNKGEESFNLTTTQYMRFFRLYRQESVLWDPQHDSYSVRTHRRQAIDRIVRMMNVPGLQTQHVRLKIRSYRDMYTREIKKYRNQPKQSKPWWLNELAFLSHIKRKRVVDSGPPETEGNFSCDGTEGSSEMKVEDEQEHEVGMPIEFEFTDSDIVPQDNQIDPVQTIDTEELFESNPIMNSAESLPITSAESLESLLNLIHKDQTDMLSLLKQEKEEKLKEDHFDSFSKYVASLLRKLPKTRAYALQPKIITMITSEHIKFVNKDE